MTRTRVLTLLALVVMALAGTACSDDDAVETGSGAGSGAPDDVVISITLGGGFVPYGTDFASVPTLVLRDGTVLIGGATTAIYPGAALSPVVTGAPPDGRLDALLEAAEAAGLDAEQVDAGEPGVTDVPTTTIKVAFAGGTRPTPCTRWGWEARAPASPLTRWRCATPWAGSSTRCRTP